MTFLNSQSTGFATTPGNALTVHAYSHGIVLGHVIVEKRREQRALPAIDPFHEPGHRSLLPPTHRRIIAETAEAEFSHRLGPRPSCAIGPVSVWCGRRRRGGGRLTVPGKRSSGRYRASWQSPWLRDPHVQLPAPASGQATHAGARHGRGNAGRHPGMSALADRRSCPDSEIDPVGHERTHAPHKNGGERCI